MGADDEVALGRSTNSSAWPSSRYAGDAGMGLDIGLMHRLGVELALDDHRVRLLRNRLVDVAERELDPLGDVRRLGRRWLDAGGEHVLMEKGAPSRIASITSMTCGSGSYSTSISFKRFAGNRGAVAATAATAWPS